MWRPDTNDRGSRELLVEPAALQSQLVDDADESLAVGPPGGELRVVRRAELSGGLVAGGLKRLGGMRGEVAGGVATFRLGSWIAQLCSRS